MDISNINSDENGIPPKAHIININPELPAILPLPALINLRLDIERWTATESIPGILVKITSLKAKTTKANDKPLKLKSSKKKSKSKRAEKESTTASMYQTVEILTGFKRIYGATKHVKLRIETTEHTLLLSATDTDKGAWSIIKGFEPINEKPILAPFDNEAYASILHENLGTH